jgi:membrane associated rhomboid family serine protease
VCKLAAIILVGSLVGLYVFGFVQMHSGTIGESLVLIPDLVPFRPWTLVTHMFVHFHPNHFLINIVALSVLGPAIARVLGRRHFIILFLGSGIGGALAVLILAPQTGLLGANAGILGLCFAYVKLWQAERPLFSATMRWVALGILVLTVFGPVAGFEGTSGFASFGGLVAAWALFHWRIVAPAGNGTSPSRTGRTYSGRGLAMKPTWIVVVSGILGAAIGFLVRPEVPVVGKLPFHVVLTRGGGLTGLDKLLMPMAQTSFNYMLIGLFLGIGAAVVYVALQAQTRSGAGSLASLVTSLSPPPAGTPAARDERDCPWCSERVLRRARVCKHCGRDILDLESAT